MIYDLVLLLSFNNATGIPEVILDEEGGASASNRWQKIRYRVSLRYMRNKMAEIAMLDRAYHNVMGHFVNTGRAPHYIELSSELGISIDEGQQLMQDLLNLGLPGVWIYPDISVVASVAPFNNLPTQYLISVDGEQKWFGQ